MTNSRPDGHNSVAQRLAATAAAGIVAGLSVGCAHGTEQTALVDIPKVADAPQGRETDPATPRRAEPLVVARDGRDDCCKGRNDCKGKGNCKVLGANACKGQNPCKSHGGCRPSNCDTQVEADRPDPQKSCCKGQNQCKGMGNCKTTQNACKGLNACKGQGGCKGAQCP